MVWQKKPDITGKKYGMRTVVGFSRSTANGEDFFNWVCECGNTGEAKRYSIQNTHSCGCVRVGIQKDHSGSRFGKLAVIGFSHRDKQVFWNCECDCGNHTQARSHELSSGRKTSCGCEVQGTAEFRIKTSPGGYKNNAKERGLEFDLEDEVVLHLVQMNCYYCGAEADPVNGIDRVDNSRGYLNDNVVTCCKRCNRKKQAASQFEFFSWVKRVYEHMALNRLDAAA